MKNKLQFILLAIVSGLLLGFAWPGTGGLTPLIFIGFVPLLFIESKIQSREHKGSIFGYAYLTFFFFNLIVAWWVYCVDEEIITKLISGGTPVLVNPLFMAIAFTLFSKAKKRLGETRGYVAFVLFWLAFEYLHHNWDLSYPWVTLGNVFAIRPTWVQWYNVTGVLGGSLWILLINLFAFKILTNYLEKNAGKLKLTVITLVISLLVPLTISIAMYYFYEETQNPVNITIIQPNIDPYNYKFVGSADDQIELMLNLAKDGFTDSTDYVLGPETALPYSLWMYKLKETPLYQQLEEFNAEHPQTDIILGAALAEMYDSEDQITPTSRKFKNANRWYDHFNSAIQVDQTKEFQVYHKSKLVLGVEMMPFPQFFRHFQEAVFDLGGTTGSLGKQDFRGVFKSSKSELKIAPVICWESVFGEFCGDYIKNGANLIFVLTNDGWWADTPGHVQHLHYARLRAIETRRSIARSANTGISCFINQRGDITAQTEWWKPAAINGSINANDEITVYTKFGDYIGRLAAFCTVLMLLWVIVKRFSNSTN